MFMLSKAYNPKEYEAQIYRQWEESGFFNPDNLSGEPYSIMMPPPNVTGVLHLGHALENSLMDVMARFQRMRGKKVLLLPGTDHAAVATQAKVEKLEIQKGIKNPREYYGREKLTEIIREYSEKSKATILSQIKKMGTSADWSRLAYTFDEPRNRAVNKVFERLYEDELIYRGTRLVNWSIGAHSVLSDDELIWENRTEPFYYIRCGEFVIGTVRSETKNADSPVVVHPDGQYVRLGFTDSAGKKDSLIISKNLYENTYLFEMVFNLLERHSDFEVLETMKGKDLQGKQFWYETYAGQRQFEVIADEVIDMEKGTGAMTISVLHSADDYELAKRHNFDKDGKYFFQKITPDGLMTHYAGLLEGLTIEDARKKSVEIMKEKKLIVGIDDAYIHRVPLCYRSDTVVEPRVSTQWFVNVEKTIPQKGKTFKELMKEAVVIGHNGDPNQKIKITPERFEEIYFQWIDNLRDWCISRQIWWGHRIPVWYKKSDIRNQISEIIEQEIYVGIEPPKDLENWEQDPDTLDTWFSSGLWTFSTLGWPQNTDDLKTFHPTSWMQMGYEILFFWMARMILMSTYVLDQIPFRDVYIHGILRDEMGKKFSKSSGNTVDPLDVIEEFGTDALRFSLVSGISPGNDARFYDEKVAGAQHLVNKIWNIARFILTKSETEERQVWGLADRWIITRLNQIIIDVTDDIEHFRFSIASEKLRDFTWNDLADWYLEISKIEKRKSDILIYILQTLLKLWHPFMPFVTEAIYQHCQQSKQNSLGELLMVQSWPTADVETHCNPSLQKQIIFEFSLIQSIVTGIRTVRNDYNIDPKKEISVAIQTEKYQLLIDNQARIIQKLIGASSLTVTGDSLSTKDSVIFIPGEGLRVYIKLCDVIDIVKEQERLKKELKTLKSYITSLQKKLKNSEFVAKAPESVVAEEKQKYEEAKIKLEKFEEQLKVLLK